MEFKRLILVVSLLPCLVSGKPTLPGKVAGPCAGATDPMDCLHGILMHGDEHSGESHKAEDNYLKFKSYLETGRNLKIGPLDADEMFHGALMHGDVDTNGVHTHDENKEMKPESPAKMSLPEDAEEFMHGVLMHGDAEPGHDHKKDHQKLQQEDNEQNVAKEPSAADLDNMMHKLMHKDGDISHDDVTDETKEEKSNIDDGVGDLDNMMHKLMHKDGDLSHKNDKEQRKESGTTIGPNTDDLHGVLMHGDDKPGRVHEHTSSRRPFKLSKAALKELNIDEEILKSFGLDTVLKDLQEYDEWQKENPKLDTADMDDMSGSILSDIDAMKKRYLKRAKKINFGKTEGITEDEVQNNIPNTAGRLHSEDDKTHLLELVGNTAPLSERHKINRGEKSSDDL